MRLKTLCENSMRIILLLMAIQFFSLATNPDETAVALATQRKDLKAQHSKSLTLSVFVEEKSEKEGETENEDERFKSAHFFELSQIFLKVQILANSLQSTDKHLHNVGMQFDMEPPLFKLHHIYLI